LVKFVAVQERYRLHRPRVAAKSHMKKTLLTFLTRIAFHLGDFTNCSETLALLNLSLGLLDDATLS